MTPTAFENIQVGTDIARVEAEYGSPYDVKALGCGVQEYRYIQRLRIAPEVTEQTNFLFRVSNGKVISKQCQQIQNSVDLNISN